MALLFGPYPTAIQWLLTYLISLTSVKISPTLLNTSQLTQLSGEITIQFLLISPPSYNEPPTTIHVPISLVATAFTLFNKYAGTPLSSQYIKSLVALAVYNSSFPIFV